LPTERGDKNTDEPIEARKGKSWGAKEVTADIALTNKKNRKILREKEKGVRKTKKGEASSRDTYAGYPSLSFIEHNNPLGFARMNGKNQQLRISQLDRSKKRAHQGLAGITRENYSFLDGTRMKINH